jgi:hypothetical protein
MHRHQFKINKKAMTPMTATISVYHSISKPIKFKHFLIANKYKSQERSRRAVSRQPLSL